MAIVISTVTMRISDVDRNQITVGPGLGWTMVALVATTVAPLLVQTTVAFPMVQTMVAPQASDPGVATGQAAASVKLEDMVVKVAKVAWVDTVDLPRAVAAITRAEAARDTGVAVGKMSVANNAVDM